MANEVLFNPPPTADLQLAIHKSVQQYFDLIPQNKIGGVFGVATKDETGKVITNAVVAIKAGDSLEVVGYVGKVWGKTGVAAGGGIKFLF